MFRGTIRFSGSLHHWPLYASPSRANKKYAFVPVLVEQALDRYDTVFAAAGTPHAVFPTCYDELLRLSGGSPSDVRAR